MTLPTVITSLSEYLDWVKAVYSDGSDDDENSLNSNGQLLFFRGHFREKYKLSPSVFRTNGNYYAPHNEKRLFLDFKNSLNTHMDYVMDTENILIQMQHHELPTRLLDWTIKPLMALFFAVYDKESYKKDKEAKDPRDKESEPHQSKNNVEDGEIFALNPWAVYGALLDKWRNLGLNTGHPQFMDIMKWSRILLAQGWKAEDICCFLCEKFRFFLSDRACLNEPLPFVGRRVDARVAPQGSCFVIWGSRTPNNEEKGEKDNCNLDNFIEYKSNIKSIKVDKNSKCAILEELLQLGINPFEVYPDFEGMKQTMDCLHGLFRYSPGEPRTTQPVIPG